MVRNVLAIVKINKGWAWLSFIMIVSRFLALERFVRDVEDSLAKTYCMFLLQYGVRFLLSECRRSRGAHLQLVSMPDRKGSQGSVLSLCYVHFLITHQMINHSSTKLRWWFLHMIMVRERECVT